MNYWINFILVMISVGASDMAWTIYIIKAGQKKAFQAAIWGSVILMLSGYSILSYTQDHSYLIAAVIGGFVGTYFTVKYIK